MARIAAEQLQALCVVRLLSEQRTLLQDLSRKNEDLLQLDGIPLDRGQRGGEIELHADTVVFEFTAHERQSLAHDLVQVEPAPLDGVFAQERAQPADDVRGALTLLRDVAQDLVHLLARELVRAEETAACLGVRDDRREGLVHLVRERRRELAGRRDPRNQRQMDEAGVRGPGGHGNFS